MVYTTHTLQHGAASRGKQTKRKRSLLNKNLGTKKKQSLNSQRMLPIKKQVKSELTIVFPFLNGISIEIRG